MCKKVGGDREAPGPWKAGVLRLRVGIPEVEKMPWVLTSLEKSPNTAPVLA